MRKLLAALFLGALFVTPACADWTGKDASSATITFKNPNTCSSVVCTPIAAISDPTGANLAAVPTAGADAQSNTANGLLSYGRNLVFNGTTWDRWQGAVTVANGANTAEGTTTDSPAATPTSATAATLVALSKAIANGVTSAIPAGTNTIGNVNSAVNVTATACSGTIATGGTAQNAFTAQTTLHGFTIVNIDTTEPLWISFTTTAAASGTDSYPLQAATATTFASPGSFTTPTGFGLNHALSVIAATTSHKYSCTWW
jgi:hypothetical protein